MDLGLVGIDFLLEKDLSGEGPDVDLSHLLALHRHVVGGGVGEEADLLAGFADACVGEVQRHRVGETAVDVVALEVDAFNGRLGIFRSGGDVVELEAHLLAVVTRDGQQGDVLVADLLQAGAATAFSVDEGADLMATLAHGELVPVEADHHGEVGREAIVVAFPIPF